MSAHESLDIQLPFTYRNTALNTHTQRQRPQHEQQQACPRPEADLSLSQMISDINRCPCEHKQKSEGIGRASPSRGIYDDPLENLETFEMGFPPAGKSKQYDDVKNNDYVNMSNENASSSALFPGEVRLQKETNSAALPDRYLYFLKATLTCPLCHRLFYSSHEEGDSHTNSHSEEEEEEEDGSASENGAVVITTCGHFFCSSCINTAIEVGAEVIPTFTREVRQGVGGAVAVVKMNIYKYYLVHLFDDDKEGELASLLQQVLHPQPLSHAAQRKLEGKGRKQGTAGFSKQDDQNIKCEQDESSNSLFLAEADGRKRKRSTSPSAGTHNSRRGRSKKSAAARGGGGGGGGSGSHTAMTKAHTCPLCLSPAFKWTLQTVPAMKEVIDECRHKYDLVLQKDGEGSGNGGGGLFERMLRKCPVTMDVRVRPATATAAAIATRIGHTVTTTSKEEEPMIHIIDETQVDHNHNIIITTTSSDNVIKASPPAESARTLHPFAKMQEMAPNQSMDLMPHPPPSAAVFSRDGRRPIAATSTNGDYASRGGMSVISALPFVDDGPLPAAPPRPTPPRQEQHLVQLQQNQNHNNNSKNNNNNINNINGNEGKSESASNSNLFLLGADTEVSLGEAPASNDINSTAGLAAPATVVAAHNPLHERNGAPSPSVNCQAPDKKKTDDHFDASTPQGLLPLVAEVSASPHIDEQGDTYHNNFEANKNHSIADDFDHNHNHLRNHKSSGSADLYHETTAVRAAVAYNFFSSDEEDETCSSSSSSSSDKIVYASAEEVKAAQANKGEPAPELIFLVDNAAFDFSAAQKKNDIAAMEAYKHMEADLLALQQHHCHVRLIYEGDLELLFFANAANCRVVEVPAAPSLSPQQQPQPQPQTISYRKVVYKSMLSFAHENVSDKSGIRKKSTFMGTITHAHAIANTAESVPPQQHQQQQEQHERAILRAPRVTPLMACALHQLKFVFHETILAALAGAVSEAPSFSATNLKKADKQSQQGQRVTLESILYPPRMITSTFKYNMMKYCYECVIRTWGKGHYTKKCDIKKQNGNAFEYVFRMHSNRLLSSSRNLRGGYNDDYDDDDDDDDADVEARRPGTWISCARGSSGNGENEEDEEAIGPQYIFAFLPDVLLHFLCDVVLSMETQKGSATQHIKKDEIDFLVRSFAQFANESHFLASSAKEQSSTLRHHALSTWRYAALSLGASALSLSHFTLSHVLLYSCMQCMASSAPNTNATTVVEKASEGAGVLSEEFHRVGQRLASRWNDTGSDCRIQMKLETTEKETRAASTNKNKNNVRLILLRRNKLTSVLQHVRRRRRHNTDNEMSATHHDNKQEEEAVKSRTLQVLQHMAGVIYTLWATAEEKTSTSTLLEQICATPPTAESRSCAWLLENIAQCRQEPGQYVRAQRKGNGQHVSWFDDTNNNNNNTTQTQEQTMQETPFGVYRNLLYSDTP